MKLPFYAGSQPHFSHHLAPIWLALPDKYRGPFHAKGRAADRAIELGIAPIQALPRRELVVVVASAEDYRAVRPAKVVMVNHGVGMTYNGNPSAQRVYRHQGYSGGRDRERIVLNLCPSERDAEINRLAYPDAKSVAVGVPYLDKYHLSPVKPRSDPPVVVWSSHCDIHICPETRWAMPEFECAIPAVLEAGVNLVGHSHPRFITHMRTFWKGYGVRFWESYSEVLDKADLFINDNSSSLYEIASTGRPVVVLNSKNYRRNVHHGLRFWQSIPGLEVDHANDLVAGIEEALKDPPYLQQKREEAVRVAYDGHDDNRATERAVSALIQLAESYE